MDPTESELREVAELLLLVQAALPAIFFAGMLAANQSIRGTIQRARNRLAQGGETAEQAIPQYLSGLVVLFSLIALVLALFIIPTLQVSLYIAGEPSSVMDFLKLQLGTYVIVWSVLAYFLIVLVPRRR